ncbi:clavesin-2-like [Bacillus rossius redtenbacheri]|uniref:clavesin-2-like n=1 Tax=Bacillus rossius redtenbacheri TaxID=93214 RepID=UPI002FDE0F31
MAQFLEFSNGYGPTWEQPVIKVPQSTKKTLLELHELMKTRPDIDFQRTDEDFLMRFLHARKCIVEDAFELLVNYYSYHQRNEELFARLSVEDESIQLALKDGFPGVLKNRDRKGRCVMVLFAAHWDPAAYSLLAVYRSMLLSLEHLVRKPCNQLNGFVVIVDWSDFSYRQSSNLNPRMLKLMIEGLQDCFPARFKAVHFISQPWYVDTILTVIRPFLKEKTKKRIFLHGNNLSTLHEKVPKDVLPAELGGEGPSYNPLLWANKLIESGANLVEATPKPVASSQNEEVRNASSSKRTSETYTFDAFSEGEEDD